MKLTEKQLEVLKILKRFDIRFTSLIAKADRKTLEQLYTKELATILAGCYIITEDGRRYLRRRSAQEAPQSPSLTKT